MIDFSLFHFLRPQWFFALIPMALLLVFALVLHRKQSGWQGVLPAHLYGYLVTSQGSQKRRPPLTLVAIGWMLGVTALAGPTWQQLPQPVYQLNAGKVLLIDMSMSMRATDIKPDRLTLAKFKAIDLINNISEGDVGLVAYAGDAFRISPLSADAQNLTTLLPSLSPEIMPVAGSDPALGIKMAADLLKAAGYFEGDIYWITDGVEMSQVAELNEMIDALPYRISVLGVGTAQGAPIQLVDGDFLKDSRGAIVIPKLNSQLLAGLAQKSGGKYANLSVDDTDINYLIEQQLLEREADQSETNEDKFGDQWQEDGPYLLLILLPIAAFAFRRGYIVIFMVTLMSSAMVPTQVQAAPWKDWFKNDDQRAKDAFEQQQYTEAAKQFDDPLWQGAALYRSEDYAAAVDAFSKVETPQAWYNKGNALAQLGELDKAIDSYNKVLDAQPEHQDALRNKKLLEKLQEQQEQQQQDSADQDGDPEQQQGENQESSDGQSQQQEQQNQEQNSDQQEQAESQQSQEQQNQSQQQDGAEQDGAEQDGEPEQADENKTAEQQQNDSESQQTETENQQAQQGEVTEQPLTDEEREQMQRLENLLKKVPDDPAFLLKRKMMLENQQRRRERAPSQTKRTW